MQLPAVGMLRLHSLLLTIHSCGPAQSSSRAASSNSRANDAWDINLGGDTSSLTQGGDNIAFPERAHMR